MLKNTLNFDASEAFGSDSNFNSKFSKNLDKSKAHGITASVPHRISRRSISRHPPTGSIESYVDVLTLLETFLGPDICEVSIEIFDFWITEII